MSSIPRMKTLSKDAFPEAPTWMASLIQFFNEAIGQLSFAINRNLTRAENFLSGQKLGVQFTTPSSGTVEVPVKWDTVTKPSHVYVDGLSRVDGAVLSSAWSNTWRLNQSGQIVLSFQGLSTSTSYSCNVVWE